MRPEDDQNQALGATLALLAMGSFAVQDALMKHVMGEHSMFQAMFLRSCGALLPVLILLGTRQGFSALRLQRPLDYTLLILTYLLGFSTYYFAISRLPLADAVALALSAPLFLTALAPVVLGERVGIRRWSATAVGFVGVLVMVRPSGVGVDWLGTSAAVGTAVFTALIRLQTRRLCAFDSPEVIVFYVTIGYLLCGAALMPWYWTAPASIDLTLMLGLGLITFVSQYTIVQAYRMASASVIAPMDYTVLPWAALLGYAFWREIPSESTLLGAPIVIASSVYVVYREYRRKTAQES